MKIKGFIKDISGYFKVIKMRKKAIKSAKEEVDITDNVLMNQKKLHQGIIHSKVVKISKETQNSVRIRFNIGEETYLIAGTYLSLKLNIKGLYVTRPYSVITSPESALKDKYVEIIVKEKEDGFVSLYLNRELKEGDKISFELNQGEFSYNSFRDKKELVFIAGGVGITPFISLSNDLLDKKVVDKITILYGVRNINDILAKKDLDELINRGVKVIYIVSEDDQYNGEKGFIDKSIINKYAVVDKSTFYICGPSIMVDYVKNELSQLGVDIRKVRTEGYINPQIEERKEYNIENRRGLESTIIKALSNESILTALEKSGIKHDSSCRSGRCGYCHIKVISGEYQLIDDSYIRYSDKELGYVHSCITYPKSDLIIQMSIEQ